MCAFPPLRGRPVVAVQANLGANWFTDLRQVVKAAKDSDGGMSVSFEQGAANVNSELRPG